MIPIEVIPAIDIRGGKCVRLYQGDFNLETVFSNDPLEMALQWQSLGATRLHIVDLDGAATGEPGNLDIISAIASTIFIPIEVGGGIRSVATMEKLLKLGADRVVLGTSAVNNPEMITEACRKFCQAIVVSIDARGGFVATHGWKKATEISVVNFARSLVDLGVRRFVYTDISRDGTPYRAQLHRALRTDGYHQVPRYRFRRHLIGHASQSTEETGRRRRDHRPGALYGGHKPRPGPGCCRKLVLSWRG